MKDSNGTWLLDGCVLVALATAGHTHHERAERWFQAHPEITFATCSITEGTLLRLYMRYTTHPTLDNAWRTLRSFHTHPRHVFWDSGFSYTKVSHKNLTGARQVTDAWLAELARRKSCRIATLDNGIAELHPDVVSLISEN